LQAKEQLDGGQIDGQEVKVQFTKPQSIASGRLILIDYTIYIYNTFFWFSQAKTWIS
jgi:hypothetical protein